MSILFEILYWIFVFMLTAALLFCAIYTLVLFSDLMIDHINPVELCDKVNFLIYPEFFVHVFLTLTLLAKGHWLIALLNLPLIAYNINRYRRKKHLLDNTRVFSIVGREQRICEVKMGFFLLTFFVYLYCFVMTMIRLESETEIPEKLMQ
ncbi:hypothetical protein GAYE_PCTG52G1277 [Galdieria yellowstonensis]|uniref:Cornichon n=1 Tax=Galdieria yellowstonensis TaxID=3028027 RepID=A0AAV9I4M7_9RHOD|nr:hypothetical protein GAYE_PCTG52G1277 [Galdieria yellowstonensis]